jgi:GMP synthase-like glutamine amidotransferase
MSASATPAPTKTICVLQHVEAEYLGLMEDHLESRNIRFHYARPFVPGGRIPASGVEYDGLIILGAGPLGVVSGNLVPSLGAELRLTADFLVRGLPVIGIGIGAVMLAVAAGGGAEEAPLRFAVGQARRADAAALGGNMPESLPFATYMRDRPVPPAGARTLAADEAGLPVVFGVAERSLGFLGHPGIKSGMVEDLIMEFDETPDGTAATLARLRSVQGKIAEALTPVMAGIVELAGWMA